MAAARTRVKQYLVSPSATVLGSKLPSKRQVIQNFLHHHAVLNKSAKESVGLVLGAVLPFWENANIPVRDIVRLRKKVEALFEEWKRLKKNASRRTQTQKSHEDRFVAELENLFDIAHGNAMNMIKIQEDKDFLQAQREPGRRGTMSSAVDMKLEEVKKRKRLREQSAGARTRKHLEQNADLNETVMLEDSTSQSEADEDSDESFKPSTSGSRGSLTRKRGRMAVINANIGGWLDRHKVSDRAAVGIIAATASSFHVPVEEFAVNRSTIRKQRRSLREQEANFCHVSSSYSDGNVIHWDGKIMPDITGKGRTDRLPVLLSGSGESVLLGGPKLASGTGRAQADAVFKLIRECSLEKNVVAMCFDTTSSNTGCRLGACSILENLLGKELFWLACRHHVLELVIGSVFTEVMGCTKSPEVFLFSRFKSQWDSIDQKLYDTTIDDEMDLTKVRHSLSVLQEHLGRSQPRDDYREMIELSVILLGSTPPRGVRFLAPGPVHHSRWMAKAIYSMKIWLFRSQFKLTPKEEKGLKELVKFVILVYTKYWVSSPDASKSCLNDLTMLKDLVSYSNTTVGNVAARKLGQHLWYLSEHLVGFGLFDDRVPLEEKRRMLRQMKFIESTNNPPKRIRVDLSTVLDKKLSDFASRRSMAALEAFDLAGDFLDQDPQLWAGNINYIASKKRLSTISVTNDHAERGVALVQQYSGKLTKDEDQLQFLLKVVSEHRKKYPDALKKTIIGSGSCP